MGDSHRSLDEVSLLVALPDSLEAAAALVGESDYLVQFRKAGVASELDPGQVPELSAGVFAPTSRICGVAQRLGARVVREARLTDLVAHARGARVVIVFAHWKGGEVKRDDLVTADMDAFVSRLQGMATPLAAWLSDAFQAAARPARWWQHKKYLGVVQILNASLDARLPHPLATNGTYDEVHEDQDTRHARRRMELDALFHGLLREGNRLELTDGLHSLEDLDRSIDASFSGVIDLATCTSGPLAEQLSTSRRRRVRTVHVTRGLQPFFAALDLELALGLLATEEIEYQAARLAGQALRRRLQ